MNVIYKGLQRLEISNVGLAGTLTCLYRDISNHYALNLGYCFSVGWDMVCRLVFCYTLLISFLERFWNFLKLFLKKQMTVMSFKDTSPVPQKHCQKYSALKGLRI